jgi:hypothetical protein
MPIFDGLGFTPQQAAAATWVFAIAMAMLVAWSSWKGRTEPANGSARRSFLRASVGVDLSQPLHELIDLLKLLTNQVGRLATAFEEETERLRLEREVDDAVARRSSRARARTRKVPPKT